MREHFIQKLKCISAYLAAVGLVGCMNQITGIDRSINTDDDDNKIDLMSASDLLFSCDENVENIPATSSRRLTAKQLKYVVEDLLRSRLQDSSVSTILTALSDDLDNFSLDYVVGRFTSERSYMLEDSHVLRLYNLVNRFAQQVTQASYISRFTENCSDAPTSVCIENFIKKFSQMALRRPPKEDEIANWVELYSSPNSGGFAAVISAILLNPDFLFRFEYSNRNNQSPASYALASYELASRLSFYLWQSIPDQSLLDAAASGELLSSPQVYEAQVNRMLADPKTKRSIREFVYEWLELYELPAEVDNSVTFTHFAGSLNGTNFSSLRQAMVDEVLDFAVHIIFEKKGRYSDLLLSRWFSTNSAVLAQQVYGLDEWNSGVTELPSDERSGIFTRAALFYNGQTDTHPILRATAANRKIFCETVATTADISTPPGITIEPWMSTRQKVELSTETPGTPCAGCHVQFNSKGFVFENYDSLGRFRRQERVYEVGTANVLSTPTIDASVVIPLWRSEPQRVANALELSQTLASSPQPHACFTRAVWTFANGFSRDDTRDACSLRGLYRSLVKEDGNIINLMKDVTMQEAFKNRRAE